MRQKYLTVLVNNADMYQEALDIFDELEDARLSVIEQLEWQGQKTFFEIYKIEKIATASAVIPPREVTVVFE